MSFEKSEMKSLKKGVCVTQLTQNITEQELVTAVAMAAISRSDLPIDKLREKYLTINKNGEADYKRFLRENVRNHNHWSVLDHVLLHLNISGVSQWVNKLLETFSLVGDILPIAITELSTRYVDFSYINSDDFYIPDIIKKDSILLSSYKDIIDFQLNFYRDSKNLMKDYYINELGYSEKKADIKSFDDCRDLLPDGTPTSVNISISLRALPNWIKKIFICYYDEKNEELLEIVDQLKNIMKEYDFIYDVENFEKVLSSCKEICKKNLKNFIEPSYNEFFNYFKDFSYKSKNSLIEVNAPITLAKPNLFFSDDFINNREIIDLIKSIIIELNSDGIYKGNTDFLRYIYDLKEIDLNFYIDSTIDFGAYRDISRHRGLIIYSSGIPYSLDTPFVIGLDNLYSLDIDRFNNYFKSLKDKFISFLNLLKNSKIVNNNFYKFIFSYLIPMGAVKNFCILSNIDQLLHLIKERTNSSAHCQYKDFALNIALDLSNEMGIHVGYLVDDEDIKRQLSE